MPKDKTILARLKQRGDDVDEANVQARIDRYNAKRAPVISMYPKEILRSFSTNGTPQEIAAEINAFLLGKESPAQLRDAQILQESIHAALSAQLKEQKLR